MGPEPDICLYSEIMNVNQQESNRVAKIPKKMGVFIFSGNLSRTQAYLVFHY